MPRKRCYVVFRGRIPGIYLDWESCQEQVSGFRDNIYKGYNSLEEAKADFEEWMNGPVIVGRGRPARVGTSYTGSTDIVSHESDVSTETRIGSSSARREDEILDRKVVDAFALGCMLGVIASIGNRPTNSVNKDGRGA